MEHNMNYLYKLNKWKNFLGNSTIDWLWWKYKFPRNLHYFSIISCKSTFQLVVSGECGGTLNNQILIFKFVYIYLKCVPFQCEENSVVNLYLSDFTCIHLGRSEDINVENLPAQMEDLWVWTYPLPGIFTGHMRFQVLVCAARATRCHTLLPCVTVQLKQTWQP